MWRAVDTTAVAGRVGGSRRGVCEPDAWNAMRVLRVVAFAPGSDRVVPAISVDDFPGDGAEPLGRSASTARAPDS